MTVIEESTMQELKIRVFFFGYRGEYVTIFSKIKKREFKAIHMPLDIDALSQSDKSLDINQSADMSKIMIKLNQIRCLSGSDH